MNTPKDYKFIVNGRSPDNSDCVVQFGIRTDTFKRDLKRGLVSRLAQFYGIIAKELCEAKHLFRGLKRPLAVGDDMNADKSVLVYTWTPPYDFGLVGGRFAADIERYPPNPGKVFAVLIRQESRDDGVCGSIEHWSWIREARELSGAPVDWENRYEQKIWSR